MLMLSTGEVDKCNRLLFFTATVELEKMAVWHKICNSSYKVKNQFSHRLVSF